MTEPRTDCPLCGEGSQCGERGTVLENLYRDLETVRRYHGEEITAKARLIGIIIRLRQLYSPEGVGVWLFSVNRKLDGCVPWTLMIDGRLDEVEDALMSPPDQAAEGTCRSEPDAAQGPRTARGPAPGRRHDAVTDGT
jgi:hypothetical protein